MKRLTFSILLCIFLGVLMTVGVAWGLALWSNQDGWLTEDYIDAPSNWPRYLEQLNWPAPTFAFEHKGLGAANQGEGIGVTEIEITGGDLDARADDV